MEPADIADRQRWVLEAVDQHEIGLLRFAVRLLGSEDAARDAVQQTFLRLCGQSPERLRGREGPWLFAVCRSHIVDVLRNASRQPGNLSACTGQVDDLPHNESDPADAVEQADLCRSINRLVDRLPLAQREAITLWSEGFSYNEVAHVTGASEGNVRVLVHRGLKKLRQQLAAGQGSRPERTSSF